MKTFREIHERPPFELLAWLPAFARSPGIDTYLAAGTNQHLASEHDAFVGGNTLRHHHIVALTLTQLHWTQFSGIVCFTT